MFNWLKGFLALLVMASLVGVYCLYTISNASKTQLASGFVVQLAEIFTYAPKAQREPSPLSSVSVTYHLSVDRVDMTTHRDKGLAIVYWKSLGSSEDVPADIARVANAVLSEGEPVRRSTCPQKCRGATSFTVTRYLVRQLETGAPVYRYDVVSDRKKLNRIL